MFESRLLSLFLGRQSGGDTLCDTLLIVEGLDRSVTDRLAILRKTQIANIEGYRATVVSFCSLGRWSKVMLTPFFFLPNGFPQCPTAPQ